ncbi:hypothetical protein N7468_002343 [Penicillium chermesinum]|uniref:Transcription factor domain-containing protein n=1 Tax=Penicillium chermesinum TaxID=63820 RepID=A0A9W9TXI9_9EURO|nr:uncharacterized protein N7468_002343 [Penicillium chermesinum]KAJ5247360.1 hypothetical protein N7468_002343 [Penicillium chermesinum]
MLQLSPPEAMGEDLEFPGWQVTDTDLHVSLSDGLIPYIPPLSAPISEIPHAAITPQSRSLSLLHSKPWFLEDQTWIKQHKNEDPACKTFASLEPFLNDVRNMLDSWIQNGHSSIIHRRLYESGMPRCLQDAYTTVASYNSRTAAMTPTILQIADERATTLIQQGLPTERGSKGLQLHLACVQALFFYQLIRLFDGSILHRASAERQISTLRQWVTWMCEVAKIHQQEDLDLNTDPFGWTSPFDREYNAATKLWRLWILTESIRRTQVVVDTVLNLYQLMVHGWSDCSGAVMVTARRGLWEADSAIKWVNLSRADTPLLVPSMQPGHYLSEYPAAEFDGFVHMLWRFIAGPDKIQHWVEKSGAVPVS